MKWQVKKGASEEGKGNVQWRRIPPENSDMAFYLDSDGGGGGDDDDDDDSVFSATVPYVWTMEEMYT